MRVEHDLGIISAMIPDFHNDRKMVREIAVSGFILGLGLSWRGLEYMHSEFPPEWRRIYEKKNLYLGDPILVWQINKIGYRRWSEIKLPDIKNVLPQAASYGLVYGAMFAADSPKGRCFLSVARPDRELTEYELNILNDKFQSWVHLAMGTANLTVGELAVLRCFRDGMGQKEASEHLHVSESTVKQRAVKAQMKLNAKNRTQAVALALTRHLLD